MIIFVITMRKSAHMRDIGSFNREIDVKMSKI